MDQLLHQFVYQFKLLYFIFITTLVLALFFQSTEVVQNTEYQFINKVVIHQFTLIF